MSWHKVAISAHQPDFYQHGKLEDKFTQIFMVVHNRGDMALFESGWSHSDTFNYYFTPACASHPAMKGLIDSCGAVPCDEPTRETESELRLCVGSARWGNHVWCPDSPQP
jgi:hypothetical protein